MSSLTKSLLLFLSASADLANAAEEDGFAYADNQAPLNKDSPQVATNFPPGVKGIELLSPAFASPQTVPDGFANGTAGPTPQWELEHFLQSLASRNDWMSYRVPDFLSDEGRTMPLIHLSNTPSHSSSNSSSSKLRVWMQGGVHGNEPCGDQALLALLGKMDANATWTQSILDKVDILMLPRYNPDGVAYFQRYLATSLDPNRDHTKMASRQTRDIKGAVMDFAPHLGVDIHEYTAARGYGAEEQWLPAQDGQFSAMKNLNVHGAIRRLSHTLFTHSIAAAMEAHNLTWSPYIVGELGTDDVVLEETTGDAKMGDTSVALGQAVMFLFETRGIQLGDQHFERRVATALVMLEALLQTAADNAELVYKTVEDARDEFIHGDDDVVVTDQAVETRINWPYIQRRDGKVVDVPVTFFNTTVAKANLTRPRPEAYVFSRAWHDVADRLRAARVEVREMDGDFEAEVAGLRIVTAELDTELYEGIVRTAVTTEPLRLTKKFPAGSYIVSTRQKNAAHALNVLEPENIDSYTTFNILPATVGDEYQVYRLFK